LLTVAVSAPGWFPLAVGVKLTETVQDEVTANEVLHVVEAGTRLYGPVRASARLFATSLLRLLRVSARGAAVVPTAVGGKFKAAALACRRTGAMPLPVRLTVAVDGTALAADTVSVAPSIPATEGEKVT
jgi:hypothetical protein